MTVSPPMPGRPEDEASGTPFVMPASFAQRRLWFLDQMEPTSSSYNIPIVLDLQGELHFAALETSINEIIRRHESLRTTFASQDGEPVQVISPFRRRPLPLIDLCDKPEEARESAAVALARLDASSPFVLERGPLLRFQLLRLAPQHHVFALTVHHIAFDGWSMNVLFRELSALYRAYTRNPMNTAEPLLPDLPIQYADYAIWQREFLQGENLARQLDYWKRQLSGDLPLLDLPTDHPRPAVQTFRGAVETRLLGADLAADLARLARTQQATLFMVLLAAYAVLLSRYNGQEDVVIGSPIAGRNRRETEDLIGFFVNTLPLKLDLSGHPTFNELLRRVRDVCLGAYGHQDLPFEKLVEELQPERDLGRSPIFQTMFALQNIGRPLAELDGLQISYLPVDDETSKFELTLTLAERPAGLSIWLSYNTDLFDRTTAQRLLDHYSTLLAGIAARPDDRIQALPLLTTAERRQILVEWNRTEAPYPDATLAELFAAQVQRKPDATAVVHEGRALSYTELDALSNQLVARLTAMTVGREGVVGLLVERSLDLYVGLLGILKAGSPFLLLDPALPRARLEFMIRDSNARILVTGRRESQDELAFDGPLLRLDQEAATEVVSKTVHSPGSAERPRVNLDTPAYIFYTSGSTGKPKGVIGLQVGIVNRLEWMRRCFPFEPGEVCVQKTGLSFVDVIAEILGPLLQGVPSFILPDQVAVDPFRFLEELHEHEVTRLVLVPSLLNALLDARDDLDQYLPHLKLVVSSGEALSAQLYARFQAALPGRVLLNLYGSTEVSADAIAYDTRAGAVGAMVPIGRPIANTCVYILDARLRPAPVGVPGELYVGGAGVARGYLNQRALSEAQFISNPFASDPDAPRYPGGERLYKTGDRARYLPDGNIQYLGRLDGQVKVRGARVEPGEIEATIEQHPAVAQASVVLRGEAGDGADPGLVAFLRSQANQPVVRSEMLVDFLRSRLPGYMIPARFVWLDEFPLTASGKVNRPALSEHKTEIAEAAMSPTAPRDALERELTAIWERVLRHAPIRPDDNFFQLGGHSLLATQLFAEIARVFSRRLPLVTLFQAPTVEGLARIMRQAGWTAPWSPLVPIQANGKRLPFFCVHGVGGGVMDYARLAHLLGPDQPFYGLQASGLDGISEVDYTIEAMAARYIAAMLMVEPHGPFSLGGYSYGGVVAFEMARQLSAAGHEVGVLAILDAPAPASGYGRAQWSAVYLRRFVGNLAYWFADFRSLQPEDRAARIRRYVRNLSRRPQRPSRATGIKADQVGLENLFDRTDHIPPETRRVIETHIRAIRAYHPGPYVGRVTLFRTRGQSPFSSLDPHLGWDKWAPGWVDTCLIAGSHDNLLQEPYVQTLAKQLSARLTSSAPR